MKTLKYKVIKNKKQYKEYCTALEDLLTVAKSSTTSDEIELLTVLIEKWDDEQNSFEEADPIVLLHSLMEQRDLKPKDLVDILGISKGLVSDILHYKKGLSKEVIRSLAQYFKVSQEAFNRPYELVAPINARLKNARVMNTKKKLAKAS